MAHQGQRQRIAPGGPGMAPRWSRGAKDAVGTAYSTASRVWYTISAGCLNEVYFPTIDEPQIRDLQFLATDGKTFFHDERRNLKSNVECLGMSAMGFRVVNADPEGRYAIEKEIIGDPHQSCILTRAVLTGDPAFLDALQLYILCAPHLEIGGYGNNAEVIEVAGRLVLTANKGKTWLALAATVPFEKCSCGYVGVNDGWTDLAYDYSMDWDYDYAPDGNVALAGKLDLRESKDFTVGLAFGSSFHDATNTLFQSLSVPFELARQTFLTQWNRPRKRITSFPEKIVAQSPLLERSVNLLLSHEDKEFSGAMIASLSIPWGEERGDEDMGGYHLVWTRDLVKCVTGLLAADDQSTPLRALIYLAVSQREDGGFYQNFWIDGRPYWTNVQLDEVSFPIMLGWKLDTLNACRGFEPYQMVARAAAYLIREGPWSPQERWEEVAGFSPSTLAANIAALVCAGDMVRKHGDAPTAQFIEEYADFLEAHLDAWTATTQSTLYPGIKRHYIRVTPPFDSHGNPGNEDPNNGILHIANRDPELNSDFPAKDIVDMGFLELVRFGVRRAGDPLVEDSLKVVDAYLKVDSPYGPSWRRYSQDGYGQRADGTSFQSWGVGRGWPLLTGERGHYELAAGRDAMPYLRAMENFAQGAGVLPEQVWDQPDMPEKHMYLGKPTGAAIPLMWAHSEYVKLLRSILDKRIFDIIDPVEERYAKSRKKRRFIEVWKPNRQVQRVPAPCLLRVVAYTPFRLHWSTDEWAATHDTASEATSIGIYFADIEVVPGQRAPVRFTFYWVNEDHWEGTDYAVAVTAEGGKAAGA